EALEESLVLTPSSFGLQPWRFLVVEDPALRRQLREASWDQPQATDASHYLVLTARTGMGTEDIAAWTTRLAEVQGTDPEKLAPLHAVIENFIAAMPGTAVAAWNARQLYIALGQ